MVRADHDPDRRYLEDFAAGDSIPIPGVYDMTADRIRQFAEAFDPQPIHLDDAAAAKELFGSLIASGWHALSATMRLVVDAKPLGATPMVGVGIENLRYIAPVRPGDVLHATAEVLDTRPSASKPDRGLMRLCIQTFNQRDEPVLSQDWTLLLPRRPAER